ncbi:GDP-mannose 4,6-dehydratase [Pelagibacteraceae bacterium]|nr:GDP-mannose 4,6-dehydratase [Pelagibacteraceae bacterium]
MKKPISLVTGGAGFIGSHTVDTLVENDHEVRVIDNLSNSDLNNLNKHKNNLNVKFEKLNINLLNNNSIFKEVDYIYHFAGIGDIVPSIENPYKYIETNLNGTIKLLENARNLNLKKFVYAASSSCYGLAKTPTKENHEINTEYPYALSKYFGEQACFHWSKVYGLCVNSIRIFNAYGRRVKTTGAYGAVFGVFLKQKLKNKPFTIVGDGNQSRDFIFATDVAEAFYLAAKTKYVNQIYNLGNGNPQTINYIADLIGGKKTYIPARPGEPKCTWADITKITNHLNFKAKVSIENGVKIMLENIDDWKSAPLWDKYSIEKATSNWFKYLDK